MTTIVTAGKLRESSVAMRESKVGVVHGVYKYEGLASCFLCLLC